MKTSATEMSASHGRVPAFDMAEVRWLARVVLLEDSAGLSDLPAPRLVSHHLRSDAAVRDHVLWWIDHPEAGGSFEVRTRRWRWLPRAFRARVLIAGGYDGIVYAQAGAIVGHVFYQRRGVEWHAFSAAVSEGFQGRGYSIVMLLDYLAHASLAPGVAKARIGGGRMMWRAGSCTRSACTRNDSAGGSVPTAG